MNWEKNSYESFQDEKHIRPHSQIFQRSVYIKYIYRLIQVEQRQFQKLSQMLPF